MKKPHNTIIITCLIVSILAVILLSGCSSPQERSGIRTTPINRPAQWEKNIMPGVTF
ncbi:MAG: hypothetical protein WC637_00985 [Victivallales bacterium]